MWRAVVAHLVGHGKTAKEAERAICELLAPLADEAMAKHYQRGEPYEEVDAWWAGAVRAKLAEVTE